MAAVSLVPPALIVVATLHIDAGEQRYGRWVREPTATYTCNRCWWHESVTGSVQVIAFTGHIRRTHRQACPSAAAASDRKAA